MSLMVNEIFYSIQGESSYAGRPCAFARLTGCNLRCDWCDTVYAYDEGDEMAMEEVLERIERFPCRLVEITGGEPLLQVQTPELAALLLDRGWTVLVETNGSRDISLLDPRCVRIVDFKTPSSGMEAENDYGNIARLAPHDEVKLVVADRKDFDFAERLLGDIRSGGHGNVVHISPVWGRIEPRILAGWMLEAGIDARLALQLHKIIWGAEARGV